MKHRRYLLERARKSNRDCEATVGAGPHNWQRKRFSGRPVTARTTTDPSWVESRYPDASPGAKEHLSSPGIAGNLPRRRAPKRVREPTTRRFGVLAIPAALAQGPRFHSSLPRFQDGR